jgi:hypothetical protein
MPRERSGRCKFVTRIYMNTTMAEKKRRIEQQLVGAVVTQWSEGKSRLRDDVPPSVLRHICSFLNVIDVQSVRSSNKLHALVPRWTVLELSSSDLLRFDMPLLKALDLFATHTERLQTDRWHWYCKASDRWLRWTEIVPFLQRVRYLDMTLLGPEDREDLMAMSTMPNLERLHWKGSRIMKAASLAPVLQNMTRLRVLILDQVLMNQKASADVSTLFRHLPDTLIELRLLETAVAFSRDHLALLLRTCPKLTQVELDLFGRDAQAMRPDDWSLLYSPTPRVWQEWRLSCFEEVYTLPCLDVEALDHFARAKVQHTLRIVTGRRDPWSSAIWKRFVEQTGEKLSPLRVLQYGTPDFSPAIAEDAFDDMIATLMECFPHLEALPVDTGIETDAKTIIQAFKQKWPLVYRQRRFPPRYLSWEIRGDVETILDHLIDHAPKDHFEKMVLYDDSVPDKEVVWSNLLDLLLSQHHWREITIELPVRLSLTDDIAAHLARVPRLDELSIDVNRLTLSANGLADLLEHGDFEELRLEDSNHSDGDWSKTTVSVQLLMQLWRNPRRRTITLQHTILTGLSASDWIALARGWTTTRHVTFLCYVPSAECPIGTHRRETNEPGRPFLIEGSTLSENRSVARLSITIE